MRKACMAMTAISGAVMLSGCVVVVADEGDNGTKRLHQSRTADGFRVLDTDGDYSRLAGDLNLRGRVGGDLSLVAGDVDIDGMEIGGEVSIAAGDVNFNGTVAGEVSIAGGDVNWDGRAGDELNLAAGELTVAGQVEGEAHLASGEMRVTARFADRVQAQAGRLEFAGEALAPVQLVSADKLNRSRGRDNGQIVVSGRLAEGGEICTRTLEITDTAHISGTLTVWSVDSPMVADGARVDNLVVHDRDGEDCDDLVEDWD
ncbi:hypothetical protein [Maricaulis sp. CAU 1757]